MDSQFPLTKVPKKDMDSLTLWQQDQMELETWVGGFHGNQHPIRNLDFLTT
jgi:hypothetical protein